MTTTIGYSISKAIELLEAGEIVAIPTETVYGLAGNGLNEDAITKIFEAKNRPSFDPLILHTDRIEKMEAHISQVPEPLLRLMDHFSPGPLTILVDKKPSIPDLVTSGLPRVAIRIPSHPIALDLLSQLDFPLAAPSANPFGYISPTTAKHVLDNLDGKIPFILDGGPCYNGLESTIVEYSEKDGVKVLRKGSITIEQIEAVTGPVLLNTVSTSNPSAPGMLHKHYAPLTKITSRPIEELIKDYAPETIGALRWTTYDNNLPKENQLLLSREGNYREAAKNLFAQLRSLDRMNLHIIAIEYVPDEDLGRAINDKLRRATH